MKPSLLLLIVFMAVSKCVLSQDTSGGTRPNIVIPLHKTPTKAQEPDAEKQAVYSPADSSVPLNSTDRKLKNTAASSKYRHKRTVRGTRPTSTSNLQY